MEWTPGTEIIYEKRITLDGHPGIEYKVSWKGEVSVPIYVEVEDVAVDMTNRYFAVDNEKYYFISVVYQPGGLETYEIEKFLDSFRLIH
ncbi:hypothetical protein GF338_11870 [candidate division WOR-3 bacterium]|nr:hypothetical protein [candidate division WOR-3 bacterium]